VRWVLGLLLVVMTGCASSGARMSPSEMVAKHGPPMIAGQGMCPIGWVMFADKHIDVQGVDRCKKAIKDALEGKNEAPPPERGKFF